MAASPTASSSSAPTAAAAAVAAEATDGPVLSVVSKRLRALRKKYNRITQMEESLAAGKTLNREQEEVLRSKPVVAALIEELERLRDLLALVYFGSLFDVKLQQDFATTMVARTHERNCCITYDYVTDDAADLLVEADLDAVSTLASLAASRPAAAVGVSHRDALHACAHHARLWLCRADEPIHPDSTITYAGVRAKLERIMSSDYYTARTEIRATEDLAASVGSYGPGKAQESTVVPPQAPEAVEESMAVEGHKDEKEESQATEIYTDNQAPAVDAQHVDDDALVNPIDEVPSAEAEQERFEADLEDQEQKDQQFVQRRSYQNQRGGGRGGRRGYPNGRGGRGGRGGGYQNGRGGGAGGFQNGRGGGGGYYYDSGYYQLRNYNNRGRGGRSSGGSSYYNNHGGGVQGGGHGNPGRVELGANA
ncbi:hypothetical protein PVAP13_9NG154600 [Panicum virgatum]|uniref:Glycine-rich protein n=1 Tax=Panicum virgatum TaxID=38727 RepID=A0A8T0MJ04_PANVG|nr:hypothetical protein PVAP13_9NG154600 [Panicum virgatum]